MRSPRLLADPALERSLHESYKDAYSRLQRRMRSGDRSLGGLTAKSLKDPDEVVQWLDSQGHIMSVSCETCKIYRIF